MADTTNLTIAGETFPVTTPYVEGHQINAAEAKALNQTRKEAVANNLRSQINNLKKEDGAVDGEGNLTGEARKRAEDLVARYDAEYQISLANTGGGTRKDPVEKEAYALAKNAIHAKLKEQGKSPKDVDQDALAAKIEEVANLDKTIAVAKKRVKERQGLVEGLDL